MISNGKKAGLYTILVMIIASVLGLVFQVRAEVYMFAPLISVLAVMLLTKDLFRKASWSELGLHRAGFRLWGAALFIPLAVLGLSYLILWSTPYADFVVPEGMTSDMLIMLPIKLLLVLAVYTVTSSLGEEIGWRGYLLPKLAGLGWKKALLLSGFIHAAFHFPLMLAGTYHAEGNAWITIPQFVLVTVIAGILFGYVRLRTGSVWPAAIMHAVHNVLWAAFQDFTEGSSNMAIYIGGESGLAAIALYGLVAWVMLRRGPYTTRDPICPPALSGTSPSNPDA